MFTKSNPPRKHWPKPFRHYDTLPKAEPTQVSLDQPIRRFREGPALTPRQEALAEAALRKAGIICGS
jgi:hypothetical protein